MPSRVPVLHTRPRHRARVVIAALLALAGAAVALPVPGASAAAVTETAQRVQVRAEPDGSAVSLDVSTFTTGGSTRRPAVLLAHGFGGSKADLAAQARTLAERGYVVASYSARGFGASGGRIHLDAPGYEVADASRIIDTLAARPDVQLDRPGDPRVGVAGASYGGALALLAAGIDHRVDAVAAGITWNDLAQSLFPQNVVGPGARTAGTPAGGAPGPQPGVLKQRWVSLLFAAGSGSDNPSPVGGCGRFDPTVCRVYVRAATTGRLDAAGTRLLAASSPGTHNRDVRAPTLLVQGEQDALFPLDQSDANARQIAATGTPVQVSWFAGGHDGADAATLTGPLTDLGGDWFDRHLRGDADRDGSTDGTFSYATSRARTGVDRGAPTTRSVAGYPGIAPAAPVTRTTIPVRGATQQLFSPPGGSPAALTGLPGTGGALAAVSAAGAAAALGILPGESATFTSAPLAARTPVVGTPTARLRVVSSTPDAVLFASLWLVTGDGTGTATLPDQLVAPLRISGLTPGTARTVDVRLPGIAVDVPAGARLRVVVSSTDQAYRTPTDARAYRVALVGGVGVPVVDGRSSTGSGGSDLPWPLIAVLAAVVLAAGVIALVLARRSAVASTADPTSTSPLRVDGLTKTYADGLMAVDGVSWQADAGQVVGLLGPNGAGKTTTMRMLVGLIGPDAGSVHVLGVPVTAGGQVLRDVGAYIEGPGFLPHLSGRANLEAFWAATGRPVDEARLDDALDIAGLGNATQRRVRTYSHGMKARLGIAQAMLGLPAVLILDEPTNGLDAPQIARMRTVLRNYAATGRTVVISSHLLAEVEATCSHVVVMDRGRVVTAGRVDEVGDRAHTIVVTVDDADRAVEVVRSLPGLGTVAVEDHSRLTVECGERGSADVVATLVRAGVRVDAATPRRGLEQAFLSMVGSL